jgi:single-strand DNA-binding protein
MAFEVEGKLHRLFPTEQKSASFQTREFVLEIPDGNYPQLVKFQAVQERCAMLDNYKEGERIKVSFDLRGREWNGKYLTNLNAWRIERGGEGGTEGGSEQMPVQRGKDESFPADPFPNYSEAPPATGNFDDLPF